MSLASCTGGEPSAPVGTENSASADIVSAPRCGDLSRVENPTFEEFDATWERLAHRQWKVVITPPTPGSPTEENQVAALPFEAYLTMKDSVRNNPAWRDLINAMPPGAMGKFRQLSCENHYRGLDAIAASDPNGPAERFTLESAIANIIEEPYFALYLDGPVVCTDLVSPAGLLLQMQSILCPVERITTR